MKSKTYKVIGVDTFEGPRAEYPIGRYKTKQKAIDAAKEHGGVMNLCYVYDLDGTTIIFSAGSH